MQKLFIWVLCVNLMERSHLQEVNLSAKNVRFCPWKSIPLLTPVISIASECYKAKNSHVFRGGKVEGVLSLKQLFQPRMQPKPEQSPLINILSTLSLRH